MLDNTQVTLESSIQELSNESVENMDFTLAEYNEERIAFHRKMLTYYLEEDARETKERVQVAV